MKTLARSTIFFSLACAAAACADGGDSAGSTSAALSGVAPGDVKVAYYAQWSAYTTGRNFQIQDVDQLAQAAKLTHINYAFANVNEQGRCFEANQAGVGDAWADYQWRFPAELSVDGQGDVFDQPLAGNFNQLKKLKARHPHLKVLMSIGGWTWSRYFSNAALPENRAAFVASCIDLFIKGNLPMLSGEPQGGPGAAFGVFDGIDLDWEWPGSEGAPGNVIRPEDRQNFTALVQEFRTQLDAYGAEVGRQYLLSAFLPASTAKIDAGFEGPIFDHLDHATVQGYDFYGAWEPQTNHQSQLLSPAANPNPQKFSIEIAIDAWQGLGAPAGKLVVGVPAYGRGWTGVASTNDGLYQSGTAAPGQYEAGVDDYKLVVGKPGTVFRDDASGAVWKYDGNNFWSYDDPQLVRDKASYVLEAGLGGLMLWSLDGDDGTLVDAMADGLQ
jgi:chitinase